MTEFMRTKNGGWINVACIKQIYYNDFQNLWVASTDDYPNGLDLQSLKVTMAQDLESRFDLAKWFDEMDYAPDPDEPDSPTPDDPPD